MHSLSRITWSRKGAVMVRDTAKPKNRKRTKKPGMRGRDAARKLTLKVNILQVFTIDFSEIQWIVNHNSQSDGRNKSAKRWTNLQKRPYSFLSPEEFRRHQGQWYLTLILSGKKWANETSTRFSSCRLSRKSSPSRARRTSCRTHFSRTIH